MKVCLQKQDGIGSALLLRCQRHPEKITEVRCADDFLGLKDGGCHEKCEERLLCGHYCSLFCHTKYQNHLCEFGHSRYACLS